MFPGGARPKDKGRRDEDEKDGNKDDKGKDFKEPADSNTPKKRKTSMVTSDSDINVGCNPCPELFESLKRVATNVKNVESTTDSGINTESVSEDNSSGKPVDSSERTEPIQKPELASCGPSSSGLHSSSTSAGSSGFPIKLLVNNSSYEASGSSSSSRSASTRSKSGDEHPNLHGPSNLKVVMNTKSPDSKQNPRTVSNIRHIKSSSSSRNRSTRSKSSGHPYQPKQGKTSNVPLTSRSVETVRARREESRSPDSEKNSTRLAAILSHLKVGVVNSESNFLTSLKPTPTEPDIKFCIPKREKSPVRQIPLLNTEEEKEIFKKQVESPLKIKVPQEEKSKTPPKETRKKTRFLSTSSEESCGAAMDQNSPTTDKKEPMVESNLPCRKSVEMVPKVLRKKSKDESEKSDKGNSPETKSSKTTNRRKNLIRQLGVDREKSSSEDADK